jgi:adenylate cyclase
VGVDGDRRDSNDDAVEHRLEAVRVASMFLGAGGTLVLIVAFLVWRWPIPGWKPGWLGLSGVSVVAISAAMRTFAGRLTWPFLHLIIAASVVLIVAGQLLFSSTRSFGPVLLLWPILWAFAFSPRRVAVAYTFVAFIGTILIFALQPGWDTPAAYAAFLGGTFVATAWIVTRLVQRAERHATREQEARLELAALNRTLEARVNEQVEELGRLDRLRRFLSPSIAEAVISEEGESRLAPHRAMIAAFFCDLRGFTAFSAEAEPEDVTRLLQQFHSVIGPLVERYEATVGGFAGDGVSLYFNDPIPCPDPALRAIKLALDLEQPMRNLTTQWRSHGFDVGYGVGIALGYATLGLAGIEHRREYTAIGTVMNLAARLSDTARDSEVLLDKRAAGAVMDDVEVEETDLLALPGFPRPVSAFRVVALRDSRSGMTMSGEA